MSKQVKQLIILAGLILFMVVVMLNNFKATKNKSARKQTVTPTSASVVNPGVNQENKNVSAQAAGAVDTNKLGLQRQRAGQAWGRDPFRMSASKEYQRSDLILKGISFGGDGRGFAFINNDIVKPGDKLGDYEVVSVERDKVLVQKKDSQSFYLTLPKE